MMVDLELIANLNAEIEALRAALHKSETQAEQYLRERDQYCVKLAGCGVAAMGYAHDIQPDEYGYSAAMADVIEIRGKLERAEHMAALWKRAAKKLKAGSWKGFEKWYDMKNRAEAAEAALAALKKDARHVAKYLKLKSITVPKETFEKAQEAADRILAATKED